MTITAALQCELFCRWEGLIEVHPDRNTFEFEWNCPECGSAHVDSLFDFRPDNV